MISMMLRLVYPSWQGVTTDYLNLDLHTINDDVVLSRIKFVRIREDIQEYRCAIPDAMLTDVIKQYKAYQMFIKYSTVLIPLNKTRGKGSQGKKASVSPKPASDEESDAKPAIKRMGYRRVIKKKVSISTYDNIIPKLDVALELGKSMSLTEAPARRRPLGILFRDTSDVSKKTSPDPSQKLKGVDTLTPKEQLAIDIMQALKASRKSIKTKADVTLDWGSKEESKYIKEDDDDENIKWGDTDKEEEKNDDDDDKSINLEKTNDEETDDEFVHSKEHVQYDDEETDDEFAHSDEQVNDDEDEEMTNAEDADTRNGDKEITDTTKADAEKTEEVKDDIKKDELPPSSSSVSVSSGFSNQFLNHSSDKSTIQSPSILNVPVLVISKPIVLSPILEIPTVLSATTPTPPHPVSTILHVLQQTTTPILTPLITIDAPPITTLAHVVTTILDPLPAINQRVYVLEKDVQELKYVDHTTTLLSSLRSKIPLVVNAYLGSSLGDALQKVLQKHTIKLIQQYPQQFNDCVVVWC
ncbi:hypothetical protein Tco_0228840 [Tanacetum coccineum]